MQTPSPADRIAESRQLTTYHCAVKVIHLKNLKRWTLPLLGLLLMLLSTQLSSCGNGDSTAPDASSITSDTTAGSAQARAAIDALTARIVETPEDAALYAQRGRIYYDNGVLDRATEDFRRSIRYDSMQPDVWHALADAQMDNLRSRDALVTMIYAGSRFKDRMATLLKLAEFQLILRKYDDAIATLERAGKLDPNEGEVFFMLGHVLQDSDSTATAEAIQAYERAIELNPKLLDAWINIGQLYARRGNKIAERYLRTATEIDRNNPLPFRILADYYSSRGELAKAVETYDRAIALDPQYADALYNSGLVLLDMDSVSRARRQFELAIQMQPDYVQAHHYLGVALELQGDVAGARRAYETTLTMVPDYKPAIDALARLQAKS